MSFLTSCRKNETKLYYINDAFKSWALFQDGSYWIYQNKETSVMSKIIVSTQPEYYFSPPAPAQYRFQEVYSKFSGGFLLNSAISSYGDDATLSLRDFTDSEDQVLSYYETLNLSNSSSPSSKVVERLDSCRINNNVFRNVIHTMDTASYKTKFFRKDYYFVQHVGLVKFSIKTESTDSSWSLVLWNVIQ